MKTRLNILALIGIVAAFLSPVVHAQNQLRVQVEIFNQETKEPVPNAKVITYQPERPNNRWEDLSNDQGLVTVIGLEPGKVTFEVTAKGYNNGRFTLRIPSNLPRIEFTIELAPVIREKGMATEEIANDFNKALILTKERKYEEALAIFEKLLKEYPDIKELYTATAGVYAELNQNERALELMLTLAKMDENNPDVDLRIAELYLSLGDRENASHYYDEVLKRNPEDLYVLEKTAFSAYESGSFDKAITYYEKILSIKAENPIAHYYLGNIYYVKDDFEHALKHYEEYLKLDPENTTGGADAAKMTIEDIKNRIK